jgi:hypothetical protein
MEWNEVKRNETLELKMYQGAIFLNIDAILAANGQTRAVCHLWMSQYRIKHHIHDPSIQWTRELVGETKLTCHSSMQETLLQAT